MIFIHITKILIVKSLSVQLGGTVCYNALQGFIQGGGKGGKSPP